MAKRRKGGAWGNALGGYKLQARNKSGQFGSGTPVKRGSKAAFSSGGTPRYYAPGGKTYAKSPNAFVQSQPSQLPRTTKAQRRQAGYNATLQKREAAARSAKRKKIVIGTAVVAAGIVGGAVAYKNRDAIKGSGIAHKIGSAVQERRDLRQWKAEGGGRSVPSTTMLGGGRRFIRSTRGPAVNSAAETGTDDGFSPGRMAVKAIGASTVAGSVARSVSEVNTSIRALQAPRAVNEEGVSEQGRHVPAVGYARRLALPAAPITNSRPSGQIEHDVPLRDRPIDRTVYGSTMDRRDFNDTFKLNGETIYGSGRSVEDSWSDIDRPVSKAERASMAQDQFKASPGKNVRSATRAVKIEAADTSARKAVGNGSPRAWTARESDQLDARINYDRRQGLRDNKLFHNTTEDPLIRNSRGGTVDRVSKEEENFRNDIRTFGIGLGQNPVTTGRLNPKQQADLAEAVGKGKPRPLTGQKIPGTMDLPRTTPVARNESGEAAAQRFLDNYEDAIGRGIRPSREDRQKYKFLTGGADLYRPIPQDAIKKAAARNNRNARDRARRNGVSD